MAIVNNFNGSIIWYYWFDIYIIEVCIWVHLFIQMTYIKRYMTCKNNNDKIDQHNIRKMYEIRRTTQQFFLFSLLIKTKFSFNFNGIMQWLRVIYSMCLKGEGSSARNSSAQKICSTPKSRLLDTVRADVKKMKTG
jgi:hypothetical protein